MRTLPRLESFVCTRLFLRASVSEISRVLVFFGLCWCSVSTSRPDRPVCVTCGAILSFSPCLCCLGTGTSASSFPGAPKTAPATCCAWQLSHCVLSSHPRAASGGVICALSLCTAFASPARSRHVQLSVRSSSCQRCRASVSSGIPSLSSPRFPKP